MKDSASARIRQKIADGGPLRCDQFLDIALFDPEVGYYGSGNVRIGPEGDFVTAPHMSKLFAATLSNLVEAADAALGRPDPFLLIEGGPGEGALALALLDALQARHPDLYQRLRYVADEASGPLQERQAGVLAAHAARLSPPPAEPAAGLYLSNELLDAFPVRRVINREGNIAELWVSISGEDFAENVETPLPSELSAEIERMELGSEGVWKLELNVGLESWAKRVDTLLDRGYVATIDYGDTEERLYGPDRPEGTLRGFSAGRLVDNPYASPGLVDVTSSVNFSALMRAGKSLGWENGNLLGQRDFLFALGIAKEMAHAEANLESEAQAYALRQEVGPLLFGGTGMGDSFKALLQAKNAPLEALPLDPLSGLSKF